MNFDGFKRFPVVGFGGQVDFQGPTRVVAGSAITARNMSFDKRTARTRDGLVDTIRTQTVNGAPVTGYEVLEVIGDVNPGEYPILFTEDGKLYLETPSGSGQAVELQPPFPLPQNARMQTAEAFNCLYMAFSDGVKGLCPPIRYNGLTGLVEPASQNPVGARWVVGRFAQVGDLITDVNQHWWRCTVPGVMGVEPTWPGQIGYFVNQSGALGFVPASATSGATSWEEWTPAFEIYLPTPDVSSAILTSLGGQGTVSGGKDLYVRFAYQNTETGEGAWSDPIIFPNTVANSAILVTFRSVAAQLVQIAAIHAVGVKTGILTVQTVRAWSDDQLASLPGSQVTFGDVANATFLNGQSVTVLTATNIGGIRAGGQITAAVTFPDYGSPLLLPLDSGSVEQNTAPAAKGGPPMPRWLAELNIRDDAFFPFALNVYGAVVAHGADAPTTYYLVGNEDVGDPALIAVDPVSNSGGGSNISRPTTATSPDPGVGGTTAFNNPTYAIDGSTSTAASGSGHSEEHQLGFGETGETKSSESAIWSGFTAPPDTTEQIYLFVDYSVSSGGSVNTVTGTLEYTLDNGSNWVLITAATNTSLARTVFRFAVSGGQDYTHIKVRAKVIAADPEEIGNRSMSVSVYDIRVGVQAAVGEILLRQTASGIALNGPPIFTGETGLRYAVLIRRDDTDSLSPVDPASPIPIIFTNNEPQRIAIVPPGAPTTSEYIVALAVSGSQQAGPFFDIPVSDPVNPASSVIVKIVRDGNGLVSATVKNAIGFAAGHQVFVQGVGSGLDGSFALSSVDASINQLQWAQDGGIATVSPAAANVTEQQNNLRTGVDAPDNFFYLNFNDDFLSKAHDDTALLTLQAAPNAADISFLPTLKKMCYADEVGRFYFSQDEDPGNIDSSGGILIVEASKGGRGLGVREMTHGQIIAVKTNGGYELNTSDVTPSNWNPSRLWELHGPPCAQMIGVGENFIVFGSKGGGYYYAGADNEWVTQELQGDEQQGSWNDVDWSHGAKMWCAVDEEKKEVHFGVTTDPTVDNGFPNEVFKLSYVGGWGFPETRTRSGALITTDEGRKWSRDPIAARIGKYIKRQLTTAVGVEDNSANKPMSTHQMTYALSGVAKSTTYPLVKSDRANGVVTAVVTAGTIAGDKTKILIDSAESLDGAFSVLTSVDNGDGTWTFTWNQADVDETVFGGTLTTTLLAVRLAAFQPGRRDDNGAGYDSTYKPAYTQTGQGTIQRFAGVRGTAKGSGKMLVKFETEDPNQQFEAQEVVLKDGQAVTQFALPASNGDPLDAEFCSPVFSNGAVPGSGFELIEVGVFANPWLSGSDT